MDPGLNHTSWLLNSLIMLDLILPPLVISLRDLVTRLMSVSRSRFADTEVDDHVFQTILCVVKSSINFVLIRHSVCKKRISSLSEYVK